MSKDFTVVFEKLNELQELGLADGTGQTSDPAVTSSETLREMEEISELRRLVAEITEPEPLSYTMT